ncbi:MAG: antifreeze protein [Pseudomonadota bacterium]
MMRPDPWAVWRLWTESAMVAAEANAVIFMRLWGMAGVWSVTPSETTRMFTEKPGAFITSMSRATDAAMKGKSPTAVGRAALTPIRRKTRANSRRLAKRGLRT